jgi:valyl-tRNA synthetase
VADAYSDPEKGTGAVKITPAHDFNDYEVGRRHDLPMPSVLDAEGRIALAELGPVEGFVATLAGVDRFEARKRVVAELERLELLASAAPHAHQVPHGDRSGVPIEPRLTLQWYCDAATLAKPAIAAVEDGRTEFVPKQYENLFFAWMRDIQPWCISRQLWWGHRIPAWYGPDGHVFVEADEAAALAAARVHYGRDEALTRDEDVLDTWFSSALWPFSTLGWPERTPELAKHYPTDVLVTAPDIIFFWVARMMMMGLHFMDGEVPFRHVVIHGLVRDAKGAKMSKSKGNVLDPLELIDTHGADSVRFTLCALASPGRDIKLDPQRLEGYRAFATKLWNAARFLEMTGVAADAAWQPEQATGTLARWLLGKADAAAREATAALERFRFDEYAAALHGFTWNTYCDWFIELAKPVLYGPDGAEKDEVRGVAQHVLGQVLRLLHPVMPFVTAELWEQLGYGEAVGLTTAAWPEAGDGGAAASEIDLLVAAITAIRAARAALNVPAGAVVPLRVNAKGSEALREFEPQLMRLARVGAPEYVEDAAAGAGPGAAAVALDVPIFLPLAGVIDLDAERKRLGKDRAKAEGERGKLAGKLGNPGFRAKAEADVIAETEERLAEAEAELARLDAALSRIAS